MSKRVPIMSSTSIAPPNYKASSSSSSVPWLKPRHRKSSRAVSVKVRKHASLAATAAALSAAHSGNKGGRHRQRNNQRITDAQQKINLEEEQQHEHVTDEASSSRQTDARYASTQVPNNISTKPSDSYKDTTNIYHGYRTNSSHAAPTSAPNGNSKVVHIRATSTSVVPQVVVTRQESCLSATLHDTIEEEAQNSNQMEEQLNGDNNTRLPSATSAPVTSGSDESLPRSPSSSVCGGIDINFGEATFLHPARLQRSFCMIQNAFNFDIYIFITTVCPF